MEIINGCLLGDGYVEKKPSHGGNCRFNESHIIDHEEYVLALQQEFGEWTNKIYYFDAKVTTRNNKAKCVFLLMKYLYMIFYYFFDKSKV